MKIKLWPDIAPIGISAKVNGDKITIDGQEFDFTPLKEGARLPGVAIDSRHFVESEYVQRINGEICLTLRFPVTWETPEEVRAPKEPTVISVSRGAVKFPDASPRLDPAVFFEPMIKETEND